MKTWSFFILLTVAASGPNIVRGDVVAPTDVRNLPTRYAVQGNPLDPDPHSQRSFDSETDPGESAGVAPLPPAPGHSKVWDNNLFPADAGTSGPLTGSAMRIYLDLVLWRLGIQRALLEDYGASVSGDRLRAREANIDIARTRSVLGSRAEGRARIENGRR